MNDHITEQVSVLVDGEVHDTSLQPLVVRLEVDRELQRCWERYHLISDALKNQLPDAVDRQFAQRVMAALEGESNVKVRFMVWRSAMPGFKEAGGLALAASLAAMAVVGVQWLWNSGDARPPLQTSMTAQEPAAHSSAAPRAAEVKVSDETMNNYLIDHSAYAAASGMQGMMPYVRVVGFSSR
jgi:sigma-E factor negative regulatory protein RseA